MKTSELTGAALDWAVAKCGFVQGTARALIASEAKPYSTDWSQGGPIIERERISANREVLAHEWLACTYDTRIARSGPTALIAAMRCYVASVLGDEVEIPSEVTA